MQPPRRLTAQVLMLIVAAAMFLTWARTDIDDSLAGPPLAAEESVAGLDVDEGKLALVASVVTVGLIQFGVRSAWMGAGFVLAIVGRQLLDTIGDDLIKPGIGLWIGSIAALVAAVGLFADLFTTIDHSQPPPARES